MTITRHRYMTVEERLEVAVDRDGPDGCWLWTGATDSRGYGVIKVGGRQLGTHRVAFMFWVRELREGEVLDHLCRRPACINPDHLEPVTQRENTLRGEGPTAKQAQQTHCKRGHEFTPENTYRGGTPSGRRCRTCRRDQDRARRSRKIGLR